MKYEKILDFISTGEKYIDSLKGVESKMTYAIRKMANRLKPIINKYNEFVDDTKIDLASIDDKGNLIMNGNNYAFTPERTKALNKKIRDFKAKEADVFEPYYATEIVELNETVRDAFLGFVIKEEEEKTD